MALFNYATKEITLKIVYYGPGLSGKTTNIQYLHSALKAENKGKLLSLSTESDRTLFFDFLPVELGKIKEFSVRFQLYTVPGQVRYNATRKVVLKGADAVVFVADSQRDMREQNIESFENMWENLTSNNINPDEIPVVMQFNKRDLTNILTTDELSSDLNQKHAFNIVEAEAITGKGVEETFRLITRLVLKEIARKHKIEIQPVPSKEEVKEELKIEVKQEVKEEIEEKAVEEIYEMPEPVSLQLESETELVEPAGYAFDEEPKEPVEQYISHEEIKAAPTVEEIGAEKWGDLKESPPLSGISPEKAPDLAADFPVEIETKGLETIDIWETKRSPSVSTDAVPAVEEIIPEKEPDLKNKYAVERDVFLEEALGIREPEVPPAVSEDSLKIVTADIAKLNSAISDLKMALASLTTDLRDIKDSLRRAEEKAGMPEDQYIKEMRKEQREMRGILRDIAAAISEIKVKKNWFRF